jgi:hypothetical protein
LDVSPLRRLIMHGYCQAKEHSRFSKHGEEHRRVFFPAPHRNARRSKLQSHGKKEKCLFTPGLSLRITPDNSLTATASSPQEKQSCLQSSRPRTHIWDNSFHCNTITAC